MSEVKVTQIHRELACQALGIFDALHARKWALTGDDANSNADMRDVARELAAAEHRIRAAVIADLKALLESAHTVEGSPVFNAEYVYADSIRNLIETLEAMQ